MIKKNSTIGLKPAAGGAACTTMPELALSIPRGHIGPVFMAGLGRMIWWTGRVAIGLRYEPRQGPGSEDGRGAQAGACAPSRGVRAAGRP